MADITLVIKARNEAQAALAAVKGDLQSLSQAAQGVGGQLKSAGKALTGAGVGMSAGITAPAAAIGTAALLSAADFEQAMNMIQVSTGAGTADMIKMQAEALRLGAVTSFSGGDAAAAMLELAKSGMTTEEIMSSIGGVLDLAAAGNIDLASAATITSQTLNAFGLDASEAANIANMLAAASNNSSAEIPDLTAGLQMASAAAKQFGQSADVVTASLAILNDNAITGSDAGTSFKTMMMRLYAPTDEARAVLDRLGVSVYDATGAARPLFEVLNDMRAAMFGVNEVTVTSGGRTADQSARMADLQKRIQGVNTKLADYAAGIAGVAQSENDKIVAVDRLNRELSAMQAEYNTLAGIQGTSTTVMKEYTEAERNAMLTTLGGADAMRAMSVLLGSSEEEIAAMVGAVNQQGAASNMANARMKGLSGAVEYFKGSIDSFLISTALPFLDSISGIVRYAADAVSAFGQLPAPIKNAALAMTAAAAAIGPLLIGLGMATSAVGAALPVLAALAGPVGLVIAAVVALGVAWATNFGGIQEIAASAWASLQPTLQSIATAISTAIPAALATAQAAWDQLPATLTTVQESFNTFLTTVQPILDQVGAILAPAVERVKEAFGGIGASVGQLTPSFEGLLAAVQNMGNTLLPIVQALATAFGVTLVVAASVGTNLLASTIERLPGIVGPMIDQMTASINMISTTISGVTAAIAAIAVGDWAAAWESLKSIVTGFEEFLGTTWTNVTTMLGNVGGAIGEAVTNTLSDLGLTAAAETVQSVIAAIAQLKADIESLSVSDVLQPLLNWQWPSFPSIPDVVSTLVGWDWPSFPDLPTFLTTLVSWDWPTFPSMPGWLERLLSWQWPTPPDVGGAASDAAGAVNDAVGGIWNAVTGGGNDQLGTSYAPGGWTWVGEAGRELVRLPRGAEVVPNRKSEEMAAIGAGVTVSVGQMVVQSEMDIYTMAYRLRDVMRRR